MINYERVVQLQKSLSLNNGEFTTMLGIQKGCLAQWANGVPIHPVARKKIYCMVATMKNRESRSKVKLLLELGKPGRDIIYGKVNKKITEKIPIAQLENHPFNYTLLDIFAVNVSRHVEVIKKKKVAKLAAPISFNLEHYNPYDPFSLGGLEEGFDSLN